MALFPAYGTDAPARADGGVTSGSDEDAPRSGESALLASDEEAAPRTRPATPPADYYEDTRVDRANLRVCTLYRPARPEYRAGARALGATRARRERGAARARRYWHARLADAADAGAEDAALRHALAAAPADERLRLRHVEREEARGGAGAALRAAEEAARACADSARVRAALQRARRAALGGAEARAALAREARAATGAVRRELWARLLAETPLPELEGAAAAALAQSAADAAAYPQLLLAYGRKLREAGLGERLVQLVELVAAVNYPRAAAFPPPPEPAADERRERALLRAESAVRSARLPPHALWPRVERLRAAAHWRPAPPDAADPQRAGDAPAAAELLRAAPAPRLLVTLLRLAGVPLLPASEALAAAGGRARAPPAEALAALVRAARRLPPAHAARPPDAAAARATLAPALDPPHCYSDSHGYLTWTNALWEACCEWAPPPRRLALVCWRLRWLHSLALLAEPAEGRRLRAQGRAVVRAHAAREPLAYALCARLEPEPAAAARAALQAVRCARAAPPEHALYAARVLAELAGPAVPPARWALCCAALERALPTDAELEAPPPPALLEEARRAAAERCAALEPPETEGPAPEDEEPATLMVADASEWAAARVALAPPAERAALLARATAAAARGGPAVSARALAWREREATALVAAARGAERARAARALYDLYPGNATLALECAGGVRGAGGGGGAEGEWALGGAGAALPALLAWRGGAGGAGGAARAARALARAGARGWAAGALAVEAAGQGGGRAAAELLRALAEAPDDKWLHVRGAAWAAREAPALADAALERGLRLHTLLEELRDPL